MNISQKSGKSRPSSAGKKARPIAVSNPMESGCSSKAQIFENNSPSNVDLTLNLKTVKEDNVENRESAEVEAINKEMYKSQVERFVEVSKYFSNPIRKTASYLCETELVSYPNPFRIGYKRGGITTSHLKFSNLTLEPVYIKLYKLIPDLEQIKYINLSLSRCKRIPPGLSFTLGFVYDDVNEKPSCNAKMVFVASRKTTTPCYQICEIDLEIVAKA
ncbi:hypothetical protein NE865_06634 [Phthorimaea operculella]|nr:hypothetical protein NE865_06634 [Phthorimaea operculella]